MNTLTRWDPAKELADMQSRLSSLFSLPVLRRGDTTKEDLTVADWTPLVDIIEDDKEYLIKAELPEVKKEDVKVTVERGVLNITGERFSEKEDKKTIGITGWNALRHLPAKLHTAGGRG